MTLYSVSYRLLYLSICPGIYLLHFDWVHRYCLLYLEFSGVQYALLIFVGLYPVLPDA